MVLSLCSCYDYNCYRSRVAAPDLETKDLEVTAPEITTAEASLEVNGPLWDSHTVDVEPEIHEEVLTR